MARFWLSGCLVFLATACSVDEPSGETLLDRLEEASTRDVIVRERGGVPRSILGEVAPPSDVGVDPEEVAYWFLEEYGELWGISDPRQDLGLLRVVPKEAGGGAAVFERWLGDYLVIGSDLRVHVDDEGRVTSVTAFVPPPTPVRLTVRAAEEDVARVAASYVPGSRAWGIRLIGFNEGLFTGLPTPTEAAYEVLVVDRRGLDHHVIVDAVDARLIQQWGETVDALSRVTSDAKGSEVAGSWESAEEVIVDDADPSSAPEEAQRAHDFARETYEFFNALGRDSIDGNGIQIRNYVHYGAENNAFFSAQDPESPTLNFGPGEVHKDVYVHEFTHGVVHYTAGLLYFGQSGALNESFADVFAMFATEEEGDARYTISEGTGLCAEDYACRSMSDPSSMPAGEQVYPENMSEFYYSLGFDNGGVHINSSVPNYAAYLALAGGDGVSAVPEERLHRIYYVALTERLGPSSLFMDAREALQGAALEMARKGAHGVTYADCASILNAYAAVGIGVRDSDGDCFADDEDNCPTEANPEQRNEEACDGASTELPPGHAIECPEGWIPRFGVCTPDCSAATTCGDCLSSDSCLYCEGNDTCLFLYDYFELDEAAGEACGAATNSVCFPDCGSRVGCTECAVTEQVAIQGQLFGCGHCSATDECVIDGFFDETCGDFVNDATTCPASGCDTATACGDCLGIAGCAYCETDGRCLAPDTPSGWSPELCADLRSIDSGNLCAAGACDGTECGMCGEGCGFCHDTGNCDVAEPSGQPPTGCTSWSQSDALCMAPCVGVTGTCSSDDECCGGNEYRCYGGTCVNTNSCAMGQSLLGETCDTATTGSCCGDLTCAPNVTSAPVCCVVDTEPCEISADCCGYMGCAGGTCQCQASGQPCVTGRECCGASFCDGGTCT